MANKQAMKLNDINCGAGMILLLLAAEILPALGIENTENTDIEWPFESDGFALDIQGGAGGTTSHSERLGCTRGCTNTLI